MTKHKKTILLEKSKDFLSKYKPSPININKNHLDKKYVSINYRNKLTTIHLYPTLTLEVDEGELFPGNISENYRKNFGKNKMKLKIIRGGLRKYLARKGKYFNKKYLYNINENKNILKTNSESLFQIYAIDESINKCYFSLGNLVVLKLKEKQKIVMLTSFEDLENLMQNSTSPDGHKLYFYCSRTRDDSFLKLFEEITKIEDAYQRRQFFILGAFRHFELSKLDLNNVFFNIINKLSKLNDNVERSGREVFNSELIYNNFLILDPSPKILEDINYEILPIINLNKKKEIFSPNNELDENIKINDYSCSNISSTSSILEKTSKKRLIFTFSTHFNYKSHIRDNNHNNLNYFIEDNYINFNKKLTINFGEISDENNLKISSIFGGVGSLIFDINRPKYPLGINVGTFDELNNGTNSFIYFEDENIKIILAQFLLNSIQNICA